MEPFDYAPPGFARYKSDNADDGEGERRGEREREIDASRTHRAERRHCTHARTARDMVRRQRQRDVMHLEFPVWVSSDSISLVN
ncbi:Eukaryotic translation initiation factor 3 110 kDa subunit [Mesorhizobium ventifaucium]|uniref:Eukaryotic translation initiation factor 3 110 kDa subunit n=1 Tax=Mesorhizobium ventifaucium TaxID=666020 RepID=A0ABN8JKE9_9HYPH|nr:Eukaryotic translation initiation factor 3 110 kDa subunit [Mesorhizobium ventifaucium]